MVYFYTRMLFSEEPEPVYNFILCVLFNVVESINPVFTFFVNLSAEHILVERQVA